MFQHYSKPKENNFGFEKSGLYYNIPWRTTQEGAKKKIQYKPTTSDNPSTLLYTLGEEDGCKNHNLNSMLKYDHDKLVEIAIYITITDKTYSKDITNGYFELLSNQYGKAKEDIIDYKWHTDSSQISFFAMTDQAIVILLKPKENI